MLVGNMTDHERDRILGSGLVIFVPVRSPSVKILGVSDDERDLGKQKGHITTLI
jgi:hypothetical protein